MQFIRVKNLYGIDDGMYNADLIKTLSCDGTTCTGTILLEKTAYVKRASFSVPKLLSFEASKEGNPTMYSNLKSLYDKSSRIDNEKSTDTSSLIFLAGAVGICVGYAGQVLTSKK